MDRAYSVLEVKSVNEDQRIIEGIATTPKPDREGDIVDPMGATYADELPLLWQHNSRQPVGNVKFGKATPAGIAFTAKIASLPNPGPLKDRLDEAWQSVKMKLVRAVSIGFRTIEYSFLDSGGVRFSKTEILELSLVTIPANEDATITAIKHFDAQALAASGRKGVRIATPGASGTLTAPGIGPVSILPKPERAKNMKTISEQIVDFEKARTEKTTRMSEIMAKSAAAGTTLDQAESEEYDTLDAEAKELAAHVTRLKSLEAQQANAAISVLAAKDTKSASDVRAGTRIEVKGVNLPKGTAFARYARALALGKGNLMQSAEIAKRWDDTPEVEQIIKSAVAAGNTTDTAWAAPLVQYQNMTSEFIELLRNRTIIGRIQGLRRVPFGIKVPRQTSGATAGWVGEGTPISVGKLGFDNVTLDQTKIGAIVPFTRELLMRSDPSIDILVRDDLANSIVTAMDVGFVDPTLAAVATVNPASVTYGVTPVTASGTDADAVRADLIDLYDKFEAAGIDDLTDGVWLMGSALARRLSTMRNALGQREFPDITPQGGMFEGLPVIASAGVPKNAGSGSPVTGDGWRMILVKAGDIMLADDGEAMLDASEQASLQMDSAPTNPPTASTVMVSLWQMGYVGIRAMRFVNWVKRHSGSVQFIDAAKYGG